MGVKFILLLWEEKAGARRRLHNENLHNMYSSPNTRVMKSRRIRGRTSSMDGRDEKCRQYFGWKIQREETT
jgi:hypothetical protein